MNLSALRNSLRVASTQRMWILNGALGATAVIVALAVALRLEPTPTPIAVPWWAVAIMFFLADACMVHVHSRREAHSFTLGEVALVVGLFLASPATFVLARFLGGAVALAFVRRQRPVKLAFNAALWVVEASIAAVIFHSLVTPESVLRTLGFLTTYLATAGATVVGATLVFLAISLSEEALQVRKLLRSLGLGVVVAITNTSLGLVGVIILWRDPALTWLLLVPMAVLFLAYRAYVAERKKHQSLEFLYETARVLHGSAELGSAMLALLGQARKVFRADVAEITLLPSNGHTGLRTTLGPGDAVEVLQPVDRASVENGALAAVAHGEPVLVGRPSRGKSLGSGDVKDAMIAPLRGDQRVIGTLLVGDRLGDLNTFDSEDFQLFETLAKHAGVSLELLELDEQLKHQAFYDSLTDLPNWALFRDRLSEAKEPAVIVFDLDDFKTVNDSLGHAIGDQLLVAVAERLRRLLPAEHTPARLGGDEFAVLVEQAAEEQLVELAERVAGALRSPFVLEGKEVSIAASIGIASAPGGDAAGELVRNADVAMYKAKARGRGKYEIFEASMHAEALRRLELKAELQAAVERRELSLRYQPIVELESARVKGFEALVRWTHPTRGEMPPDEFIPLAEETGLIVPIGQWVLEEACRQAALWQARHPGEPPLTMGVNLSPVQLQRPGLVDDVARTLRAARVDPRSLILEITESVFMDDAGVVVEKLKTLKELGLQIAIDDFGTGYSSLSYLGRLPIDILKVAKPFVDGIGRASGEATLAEAIVRMSEALGLTTLAEGIESTEQRDHLARLGCDLGQGYLFAKPLDQDAMDSFLRFRAEQPREVVRHARRPALRSVG
jgi:diguanylate cyclase (GGDEF)-like protein